MLEIMALVQLVCEEALEHTGMVQDNTRTKKNENTDYIVQTKKETRTVISFEVA